MALEDPKAGIANGAVGMAAYGTAAGIAGAVLIALNVGVVGYGFVLFLISSVLWTAAAAAQREPALVMLQGGLAIIDVIGIVRWMFV